MIMNRQIKLLKDWKSGESTHKAGTVLEVDEITWENLVNPHDADPVAKSWDASDIKAEKDADEAESKRMKTLAASVVTEVMEKLSSENGDSKEPLFTINVKDRSDDDPTFGYVPAPIHGKGYDQDSVRAGFGLFCKEIYEAAIGRPPERLQKCAERSLEAIHKGAAFLNPGVAKDATKAAPTGLGLGSAQDVGFMVPPEFSMMLMGRSGVEAGVVRSRASRVDLQSNSVNLPIIEDYDRSSDLVHGGVASYWTGEAAQYTKSKPTVGNVDVRLDKLTCLGYATEEAMRFSPISMGTFLFPKFRDAITWKEDVAFLEGDGVAKPLGILKNTDLLVVIAKEGSQTASTIVSENIFKMFARHNMMNSGSTGWVTNKQNVDQLFGLKDAAGNAIFMSHLSGGISDAPRQTLLGFPVGYSEKLPTSGTQNDILLADFSEYLVADDRAGPTVAQSIHLRFDYGETAFRLSKFVGGQPIPKKSYTPKKGSAISPFVVVAVRA